MTVRELAELIGVVLLVGLILTFIVALLVSCVSGPFVIVLYALHSMGVF
jgi:hypothetical protein